MKIVRLMLSPLSLLGAALLVVPAGWSEAPLTVSSYSTYNGGTGSFNYQDFTYSNCVASDCNTTGAFLSGGTGKLTDGVSPVNSWYEYGTPTPWVGWDTQETNGTDPTVTFNFANSVTINSVTVWVDDAIGYGGVYLPSSVSIDGTSFAIAPDWSNSNPRGYTFSGLDLTGSSAQVQFFQTASYPWIMVGEVSFNGSTSVPEGGSSLLYLLLAGAVCCGAFLIRARSGFSVHRS